LQQGNNNREPRIIPAELILSVSDRQNLARRARQNARKIGLSDKEWSQRRRSNPVGRDLLMALDPFGERPKSEII